MTRIKSLEQARKKRLEETKGIGEPSIELPISAVRIVHELGRPQRAFIDSDKFIQVAKAFVR